MSWIITTPIGYVKCADELGSILTKDRNDAKRFETKADAKSYQYDHEIGGSIIPA